MAEGSIIDVFIEDEMQSAYIDWPAIRDGTGRRHAYYSRDQRLWWLVNAFLSRLDLTLSDARVALYLMATLARIMPYAEREQREQLAACGSHLQARL